MSPPERVWRNLSDCIRACRVGKEPARIATAPAIPSAPHRVSYPPILLSSYPPILSSWILLDPPGSSPPLSRHAERRYRLAHPVFHAIRSRRYGSTRPLVPEKQML